LASIISSTAFISASRRASTCFHLRSVMIYLHNAIFNPIPLLTPVVRILCSVTIDGVWIGNWKY
jgi:hypothetical protein